MMIEEWHADIEITENIAKNCIQTQFPFLSPLTTLKQIGEGWDNKVFLVNQKIIFRFPRRKNSVQFMKRENQFLHKLPCFPELQIPRPEYFGQPSVEYPYPFHGYHLIEGAPAYRIDLSEEVRSASLPVLGRFLKELHQMNELQAITMGATPAQGEWTNIRAMTKTSLERIEKIMTKKIALLNQAVFRQEARRVKNLILPKEDRCLVHGDLDARHLLFHQNKLRGIIDWGEVSVNDKAIDLAIIWSFYSSHSRQSFFQYYGEVDPITWQGARFFALCNALTLLLYGGDVGDKLLINDSKQSLERINAELLING